MAKYPAFLFYSSDFLSGVSDLTMEERGQYITLLCLQHQKGALSEKTIRLSVGSVSVDVIAKFQKNEQGNYFNKRLVEEIEKRVAFTESRRKNGNLGGRPSKNKKPIGKPTDNLQGNHMENEDENEIEDVIKKKKNVSKLFRETEFFDLPTFSAAFDGSKYESANMEYYHESILNWSDSKGEKKLDWIAAAKGWMIRDIKENKFIDKNFKHGNKAFTKPNGQLGTSAARFEGIKNLR